VTGATTTGCRGQLETITNPLNHVTTYNEYNAHGQPLMITDPNGLVTTLTYDVRQLLTSRSAGGETTTLEYWPTRLLKKATLPDGSYLQYTYDAAHRLTQVSDAQNNRIVYTLNAAGKRTKEETFDPSNYLVRLHHRAFNTLNQLWKEIGSANTSAVTTTFGYDANGNLTSVSAPLSRNTSNLYDELNRLKQITDPEGGVTLFGYNGNDNLTSVTDPRGKVTSYVYNGFGDLKQQTSPDTGVTNNAYDSGGNLQTSTDARSKTGTYTYDALNRVTQLSYPDQTITYSYDTGTNNKGRLVQVSDGSGSTGWAYTSLGRVSGRSQVMGSVTKSVGYGYNSSGQLTSLVTPSGQTITYTYSNDRISSITVNSTPLLSSVLYDPFGPARQWTWGTSTLEVRSFDQDGNLTQLESAGLRTYDYDDAFRIAGILDDDDPDLDVVYTYDRNDRLTNAMPELPDPMTMDLSATSAAPGDTIAVTLANIPTGSGYWLALARTGTPLTTVSKWIAVTPSSGGFVWNVTMPAYAGTYEVRFFGGGFYQLLTSAAITVSTPPTPPSATLVANAGRILPGSSVTVKLAGSPGAGNDWLALALVGANPNSYLQWTYVGSGVTSRDWTVTMPSTENSYEFRLFLNGGYTIHTTSSPVVTTDDAPVTGTGPQGDYTYDANGNRLSADGSTYTVSTTSNRLSSVSGAINRTYTYDAAGNTTGYSGLTFTYNDAGRMVGVSGGASASYSHNALGQRVKKTVSGVATYFVYDEAGHLIGEYNGSGNLIQETVWLGDIPVATLLPNGGSISIYYVHADHLNTPRRITRPSDSAIVWRWDSDPFGTDAANQDPDGDSTQFTYNLRFPGQYFDAETQLNYNYFRDYDPQIGRYVESDPVGLRGGTNTFAYVGSNPLDGIDLFGLVEMECPGGFRGKCWPKEIPPLDKLPPADPKDPRDRAKKRLDPDYCSKTQPEALSCVNCCRKLAERLGVWWQGQCNAECTDKMQCLPSDSPGRSGGSAPDYGAF
jgi:RHS repeat-associated protein